MSSSQLLVKGKVLGVFLMAALLIFVVKLQGESASSIHERVFKRMNIKRSTNDETWQPEAGVKWQIQLSNPVEDISMDADIFDIDLFDNSADIISEIHTKGAKVICYFSAGTYEDWRSDAGDFVTSDFVSDMDGWPGEKWLDVRSSNVRSIMQSRLDLAQQKGCDGVDPDNIDAYGNDSGLDLTESDAIDYLTFLASEAKSRGISIGLKNGGDIIPSVIELMQWSVNEQCVQYDECDVYAAFTDVEKPVFHIEYVGDIDVEVDTSSKLRIRVTDLEKLSVCDVISAGRFSTVIKNMNLDSWVEYC